MVGIITRVPHGRVYSVSFVNVQVTSGATIVELIAGPATIGYVHGWQLTQHYKAGDANEQAVFIDVCIGTTNNTSGGTLLTKTLHDSGDQLASFSAYSGRTGGGAPNTRRSSVNWNVRVPFVQIYQPDKRPVIGPFWRLQVVLTTSEILYISGSITWSELGTL